jgi:hypothetical protein
VRLLVLALLLASCATVGVRGAPSTDDNLRAATALTWESYACPGPAPVVLVLPIEQLTCTAPNGMPGFPVALLDGQGCREGYDLAPGKVSIAYRLPWSDSALRHELMHACQAGWGIIDPWHLRDEWDTKLPAARDLLRTKGL